jgi:hypothetical protein
MVKRGPCARSQASEGEAQRGTFCGLDISVKQTSVCIVGDTGRIVRKVKAASELEALSVVLNNPAYCFKRIEDGVGQIYLSVRFVLFRSRSYSQYHWDPDNNPRLNGQSCFYNRAKTVLTIQETTI